MTMHGGIEPGAPRSAAVRVCVRRYTPSRVPSAEPEPEPLIAHDIGALVDI